MAAVPVRLTLVLATWCPHCVPVSTDRAPRLAERLHVPLRILDVDQPEEERISDVLVKAHGDWSDDYLVPQVFLELEDGRVVHLLTGVPGSVESTAALWDRLLGS